MPGIDVRVVGDIGAVTDWQPILDGAHAVIHLAARVHRMDESLPPAQSEVAYRVANVDASVALARAAAKARVRRFIFLSSIKVNGESSGRGPFRAEGLPAPADAYARSKADAEQALRRIAHETGLDVPILRLPLVYGPGVAANFRALLRLCDTSLPLPFRGTANRRSLVFLDNLVDAIRHVVTFAEPAGGMWFVTDGKDLSIEDVVRQLRHHLGRPMRLVWTPQPLLRGLAALAGRTSIFDRLYGQLQADGAPFREKFGWQPPFTPESGLAATAAWYRAQRRANS